MPYVDRLNRVCGFLDIEEKEKSCRFQRRYFILDTQGNVLLWYMDNPQNLPSGASFVGSLKLTYISKVNEATAKQKPKTEFCFVINAVSRRYFLQANDATDMKDWIAALNKASKITVPKPCTSAPTRHDVTAVISESRGGQRQQAYKTEIIGGVVVHTPIQNESEEAEIKERKGNRPGVLRCGYCVKQGNVRKSWKRRFFTLNDNAVSYYKSETDKEPLRAISLRDIQKVHECLVKSGDLLLRDNLFEIITSSRTFYIQTDSPEDMRGWIRDIEGKIQEFRGPLRGGPFKRVPSLYQSHNASCASRQKSDDRRPPLMKSCSMAPGWQPWTPVPQCEPSIQDMENEDSVFSSLPTLPSLSSSSTSSSSTSSSSNSLSTPTPCPGTSQLPSTSGLGILTASADAATGRRRHRSTPQPPSSCSFPYSLDEDGIRTSDV
uniref:Pleckstrin homology domain containing, family A (Phosphoinositide binding specific) member 2 n=2 Tax=Nothobranchius pienaari TaxID=704102 RepID=A0A1A8LKR7_9TELE